MEACVLHQEFMMGENTLQIQYDDQCFWVRYCGMDTNTFILILCVCDCCVSSQMSTMPGLPTRPCFYDIDLDPATEEITGLF